MQRDLLPDEWLQLVRIDVCSVGSLRDAKQLFRESLELGLAGGALRPSRYADDEHLRFELAAKGIKTGEESCVVGDDRMR